MFARWRSTVFLEMMQQLADLLVGVRLGDELDDLLLARGQQLAAQDVAGARALDVLAHQRADAAGVEERLAAHRGAAGLDEVAVDGALEHVAGGADLDRLEEVLLVVVHREHQHAHLGLAVRDLARRLQPGLARHRDVEDREVDVLGERVLDGLLAVASPRRRPRRSGWALRTVRRPRRTIGWSSAIEDAGLEWSVMASREVEGDGELDLGAADRAAA